MSLPFCHHAASVTTSVFPLAQGSPRGGVASTARFRTSRLPRSLSFAGVQVHFANIWESIADEAGDRVALIHGDDEVRWRDYDGRAARLAGAFQNLGLGPDSKVA